MPKENREILFTENEVKIALMQFSARKGVKFNIENIKSFEINSVDAVSVKLEVFDAANNRTGTVDYAHPEVAAALLGYCMKLKIPLPKAGKKAVVNKNGQTYLRILHHS